MGAKKIITCYNICIDDFEDGDFLQDYVILGRNAVEEAIKANRNIDKLLISKNARGVKQLIESVKKSLMKLYMNHMLSVEVWKLVH